MHFDILDIFEQLLKDNKFTNILQILSLEFKKVFNFNSMIYSQLNKEPFCLYNFSLNYVNENVLQKTKYPIESSILLQNNNNISIIDLQNSLLIENNSYWETKLWIAQGYKTSFILKLQLNDELIGALVFLSYENYNDFSDKIKNINNFENMILLLTPIFLNHSILFQNIAQQEEKELLIEFSKDLENVASIKELISLINSKLCHILEFHKETELLLFDEELHILISKFNDNHYEEFQIEGIFNNFWEWNNYQVYNREWFMTPNIYESNERLRTRLIKNNINNTYLIKLENNDCILGLLIFGCDDNKILCNRENRLLFSITRQISAKLNILLNEEKLINKDFIKGQLLEIKQHFSRILDYEKLNEFLFYNLEYFFVNKFRILVTKHKIDVNLFDIIIDSNFINSKLTNIKIDIDLNKDLISHIRNIHSNNIIIEGSSHLLFYNYNLEHLDNLKIFITKFEYEEEIFILHVISEAKNKVFFNSVYFISFVEDLKNSIKTLNFLDKINKFNSILIAQNKYLVDNFEGLEHKNNIIGTSKSIKKVFNNIKMIAKNDTNVLIWGETGTGKELVANAIHKNSNFSNKLMIKVNCASIPSNLIESELFGHEKGAFTGAYEKRIGKFEIANNSTIFLDEIGELPLDIQAKLLRVIQEKEIERLGSNKIININARIIVATNRDLENEVKKGNFRSDLFYRLNVFPIYIPPLRERIEDIPEITKYFISKFNKKYSKNIINVSSDVISAIEKYTWPGNVRELEFTIERAVILSKGNTLTNFQINLNVIQQNNFNNEFELLPYVEHETKYLKYILEKCNGKIRGKNSASELLQIPPTTLYYKLVKLGLK